MGGFIDKIFDDVLGDPFGSYAQASAAEGAAQTQAAMADQGIAEQRRQFDLARQTLNPYAQAGLAAIGADGGSQMSYGGNAGMFPTINGMSGGGSGQIVGQIQGNSGFFGIPGNKSTIQPQQQQRLGGLPGYAQAGGQAFGMQQDFLGMNGAQAEQSFIDSVLNSNQFNYMTKQGEEAILEHARATGGLRGGQVQSALAQFRPQLLNQLLEQKYGRLGGISGLGYDATGNLAQLGQASAAGQASAGLQTGNAVAGLLGDKGNALAQGAILGQGGAAGSWAGLSGLANAGANVYGAYQGDRR